MILYIILFCYNHILITFQYNLNWLDKEFDSIYWRHFLKVIFLSMSVDVAAVKRKASAIGSLVFIIIDVFL